MNITIKTNQDEPSSSSGFEGLLFIYIYAMKKKLFNWLYKLALKTIAINIVNYGNRLTPEYLLAKGWIFIDGYYIEPDIKDRDLVSISFESHFYRVWHSEKRTFIACESTIEWFENYYLIIHGDNGRYKLAGV